MMRHSVLIFRLLARLLPVYEVDWNCLASRPEEKPVSMCKRSMGSVDISMKLLLKVSPMPARDG